MAARGAGAAIGDAGDRVPKRREIRTYNHIPAGFRQGLKEAGYVEGQNIVVEYRWADDEPERLAALAAGLVRRNVALIVAGGTARPALAVKAATSTIPIVAVFGGDPVQVGLLATLSRPGGNVTGFSYNVGEPVYRMSRARLDIGPRVK